MAANQALGEPDAPTDLALSLDYRIRHLLIDEFQDTSLSQYELLHRLTAGWQPGDGRTLFAVGDPMQSIYRFRQAEVGLFLRAREHGHRSGRAGAAHARVQFPLAGAHGRVGSTPCSSTSCPCVRIWRAAPCRSRVRWRKCAEIAGEAVCLHAVAAQCRRRRGAARHRDRPGGAVRRIRGKASRFWYAAASICNQIVPALKGAGLRFRAIEIEALTHRPAVQDLHALARALLHLADRVAWLAVLRAPWCALSLTGSGAPRR